MLNCFTVQSLAPSLPFFFAYPRVVNKSTQTSIGAQQHICLLLVPDPLISLLQKASHNLSILSYIPTFKFCSLPTPPSPALRKVLEKEIILAHVIFPAVLMAALGSHANPYLTPSEWIWHHIVWTRMTEEHPFQDHGVVTWPPHHLQNFSN